MAVGVSVSELTLYYIYTQICIYIYIYIYNLRTSSLPFTSLHVHRAFCLVTPASW